MLEEVEPLGAKYIRGHEASAIFARATLTKDPLSLIYRLQLLESSSCILLGSKSPLVTWPAASLHTQFIRLVHGLPKDLTLLLT
jgi:hypothetical protein